MNGLALSATPQITPYPWDSLETIPRRAVKSLVALRRHSKISELAQHLCAALESWSGIPAHFELRRITACTDEPAEPRPRLLLRCTVFPFSVLLCLDPRLCLKITQKLTKQADAPLDPLPPIDTPLLGAVAALVSHLLESIALDVPVRIGWGHLPESVGQRVALEGTLRWGNGAYELVMAFDLPWAAKASVPAFVDWTALGDIPIPASLVVGQTRILSEEIEEFAIGSVFLPGCDLWIDDQGKGRGILTVPLGDWAYPCNLVDWGKIVLGAVAVKRDFDGQKPKDTTSAGARTSVVSEPKGLKEVLADAPLTLEVELCTLSLTARQLATLAPGDVIETATNVGQPVILRVSGHAVASAELVNIEGQLGLRIVELSTGESR
jgi:flagellar motor switch/type III secretory pathway protein FliN